MNEEQAGLRRIRACEGTPLHKKWKAARLLEAGELSIRRAAANGEVWLGIGGEVDLLTADQFYRAVQGAVAEAEVGVALDLSGVTFFGSHGIGGLVSARRRADSRGLHFRIRRAPPVVVRVLEVAGLHEMLIGTEVTD